MLRRLKGLGVNFCSRSVDRAGMPEDAAIRRRRYRRLCAVTAPFAMTWVVIVVFGVGGADLAKGVSNGGLALTALVAGLSCGFTAFRSQGRYRAVWTLLALGMISW